jgi:hypothetical protein
VQPQIHLAADDPEFRVRLLAAAGAIGRRFRKAGLRRELIGNCLAVIIRRVVAAGLTRMLEKSDQVKDGLLRNLFVASARGSGTAARSEQSAGTHRRHWRDWQLPDPAAVLLALGYAIGGIGCQLSTPRRA